MDYRGRRMSTEKSRGGFEPPFKMKKKCLVFKDLDSKLKANKYHFLVVAFI